MILMPLLYFMAIQGDKLLAALRNRDMATVERLLIEDPNLIHFNKNAVRRTK